MAIPNLITREQWGALAARSAGNRYVLPLLGTAVHYNGPAMGLIGKPHTACVTAVQGIQRFHINGRGWTDIAYPYLICPHGHVFEGRRGGNAANGATYANERYSAAMCLIGGDEKPTPEMLTGVKQVTDHIGGVVKPHRAFTSTSCPGEPLASWIAAGCPVDKQPAKKPTPETPSLERITAMSNKEIDALVERIATETAEAVWGTKTPVKGLPAKLGIPKNLPTGKPTTHITIGGLLRRIAMRVGK